MAYNYKDLIYLSEEKCVGCNKCISNCQVIGANVAYIDNDFNKVKIIVENVLRSVTMKLVILMMILRSSLMTCQRGRKLQ